MNLYGYVLNNPISLVDPSGLDATFTFANGTSKTVSNSADFVSVSKSARPGSITSIAFSQAHANSQEQNIGPEGTNDEVDYEPNQQAILVGNLYSGSVANLQDILAGKFAPQAFIWYTGCFTAFGWDNISYYTSVLFPTVEVTGNVSPSYATKDPKTNFSPFAETYLNGKIIDRNWFSKKRTSHCPP